jgi:hypothetical protein
VVDLQAGGFYPDLDLEWLPPGTAGPDEGLLLTASEQSSVRLQAGAAYKITGQPLARHFPEGLVAVSWAEPHYLPFRIDAAGIGGGVRPGWGGQFLIEPPWPFWLRLSVYSLLRTHRLIPPTRQWERAGAIPFLLHEERGGIRLNLGFAPNRSLILEARIIGLKDLAPHPDIEDFGYEAADFSAGLHWEQGSGRRLRSRVIAVSTYSDPLELPGIVRNPRTLHRGEGKVVWYGWEGFFRVQYTDDAETPWRDVYDRWIAGSSSPLSFGEEMLLERWRHNRYGVAGSGLNLAWRRFGFRAVSGMGGYRALGADGEETESLYPFWEAGISMRSGLGAWRLAAGGFGDFGPFFALQWGPNLDLESVFFDRGL